MLNAHTRSGLIVGVPHVLPWDRKRELVERCLHVCATRGEMVSRNNPPRPHAVKDVCNTEMR